MGPNGLGKQNEYAVKLTEFVGSQNLKIANTFYKKNRKLKWS